MPDHPEDRDHPEDAKRQSGSPRSRQFASRPAPPRRFSRLPRRKSQVDWITSRAGQGKGAFFGLQAPRRVKTLSATRAAERLVSLGP